MTIRQLLDRAVERALHQDIRLVGNWDFLPCLAGQEGVVAEQVARLSSGPVDEVRVAKILRESSTLEEIVLGLESQVTAPVQFHSHPELV